MMLAIAMATLLSRPAAAWDSPSHRRIAVSALASLPEEVPAFLRQGEGLVASASVEPDAMRLPATAALRVAESPEHFIDLELLDGRSLPPQRYQFLALCHELKRDPAKVGLVPYAIVERAQRLATALAEHRRRPDDVHIQTRVLYHAGILAHYAADMCMPLHTTVHYDGRVDEKGRSPRSGIHLKVDALPAKLGDDAWAPVAGVEPMPQLWEGVLAELAASHALVDRVYALEAQVPAFDQPLADEQVRALAQDRSQAAVRFLARLILTSWRASGELVLPNWLDP